MKRKQREGEVICRCGAYKFPHRMMGGSCKGLRYVSEFFDSQCWGECRGCILHENEGDGCQVLQGREKSIECPALQEKIDFERIRLYGVNAKSRAGRR